MLAAESLAGPQEGLDHLILLPDCVLSMDSGQLKRDLAGLQFSLHLLSDGPQGSVWLSGATPVDPKQNGRPTSAKQGTTDGGGVTSRWLAGETLLEGKDGALQVDREERLRMLKEKQNEERQRKLEELKQQALAAQKFREQKETERRRRLEELRLKDTDRRHQVEERKRQIWEAERDRREAILRKNQEREARIETRRKNERSQIVFAFGSSTPRMLDPGDAGSSYWASRRATSTTNVMTLSMSAAAPGPLTRRSSERELDGSKKRATSAGGMERKQHDPLRMTCSSIYEVFHWGSTPPDATRERSFSRFYDDENDSPSLTGFAWRRDAARRKTDLTPTLPSPRESLTPPSSGSRTPGGGGSNGSKKSTPGMRSGELTPQRPQSSMSQSSVASNLSSASATLRARSATTQRRPRPFSIAVTGVSTSMTAPDSKSADRSSKSPGVATAPEKPPIPKTQTKKASPAASKIETPPPSAPPKKSNDKLKPQNKSSASTTPKASPLQSPNVETIQTNKTIPNASSTAAVNSATTMTTVTEIETPAEQKITTETTTTITTVSTESIETTNNSLVEISETVVENSLENPSYDSVEPTSDVGGRSSQRESLENISEFGESEMTASMVAKTRITTEEEAKAALAERRRLAREQAEREAELERQRLEAERLAEEERLRKEEEEQRKMEEEQLRLLEEAKRAEEMRLQQAIEEAQKREEEENKRKEEEAKLKLEREEAERKAKEEAEKLRIEMELRLKQEEEDRQARRKRVEAIMSRTRGGKGTNASNSSPAKDGEDDSPPEDTKKSSEGLSVESNNFIKSERGHTDANAEENQLLNEDEHHKEENNRHNGHHHNGSLNSVAHNNVTNSLLVDLNDGGGQQPLGEIIEGGGGGNNVAGSKLSADAPAFIPQFQEKNNEPHVMNDLLS